MKKLLSVLMAIFMIVIMTVPAFAENFTPSVSRKQAPKVIEVVCESGETVVAIICDEQGEEIVGVTERHLIVTPMSAADESYDSVRLELNNAQSDLVESDTIGAVVPGFNEQVKKIAPETNPDDYVVKDLFSVSLDGEYIDYLDGKNTITVTYETGADPEEPMVFMYYLDGKWQVLDETQYVRNPDGTVSITVKELGIFAFVVQSTSVDKNGPKSPYTADTTILYVCVGIATVAICLTVVALIKRKEKTV